MDNPFCVLRGHRSAFPIYDALLSLRIIFTLSYSVDPDEMPQCWVYCLSLHPLIRGYQYIQRVNKKVDNLDITILVVNK